MFVWGRILSFHFHLTQDNDATDNDGRAVKMEFLGLLRIFMYDDHHQTIQLK